MHSGISTNLIISELPQQSSENSRADRAPARSAWIQGGTECLQPERAMAQPHDFTVVRFCCHHQVCGERGAVHGERVVAHHRQVFGQSGKESLTVMTDVRRFSVHHFLSVNNVSTQRFADGLMSEADAEPSAFGVRVPRG